MPLLAKNRITAMMYTMVVFCVIFNLSSVYRQPLSNIVKTQANIRVLRFRKAVTTIISERLNKSTTHLQNENLAIDSATNGTELLVKKLSVGYVYKEFTSKVKEFTVTEIEEKHPSRGQRGNWLAPDEREEFDDSLNTTLPSWDKLDKKYRHLLRGGRSKPDHPSHSVVIIVPYRERRVHLKLFLDHMHRFLQRQNLEYAIYVVEMGKGGLFNRAAVSNAGFLEVIKREDTPCVIFHDVDLLPTNDKNLYYCNNTLRHYSVALKKHNYTLYYKTHMGGIVAFPPKLFQQINGYSNLYEGWGGEDDDLYKRVNGSNITWTRPNISLGRYISLEHERQPELLNRRRYLKWSAKRMKIDGLNSINYTVGAFEERHLFTWILVNITRAVDTLTKIKPKYKVSKGLTNRHG